MYEHDIILEASKEFGMGISAEGSKNMVCDNFHDDIKIQN
jgi:hypothetical protein